MTALAVADDAVLVDHGRDVFGTDGGGVPRQGGGRQPLEERRSQAFLTAGRQARAESGECDARNGRANEQQVADREPRSRTRRFRGKPVAGKPHLYLLAILYLV
jgi:hypothetical protein